MSQEMQPMLKTSDAPRTQKVMTSPPYSEAQKLEPCRDETGLKNTNELEKDTTIVISSSTEQSDGCLLDEVLVTWGHAKTRRAAIYEIICKLMEEYGENVDNLKLEEYKLAAKTAQGRSVELLWVSFLGQLVLLKSLVLQESHLEFCTPEGLTALHLAALSDSPECVQHLLQAGAKITSQNSISPLHCAVISKSKECLVLLCSKNSKPEILKEKTKDGSTALHFAALKKSSELLRLLLQYGADPNATNSIDKTALHLAAESGRVDCVTELLAVSSNLKARDAEGRTALHLAFHSTTADQVAYLLIHTPGVNVNAKDNFDRTPLHYAAYFRLSNVAAELIRNHADLTALNKDNVSALGFLNIRIPETLGAVEEMLDSSISIEQYNKKDETMNFNFKVIFSENKLSFLNTFMSEDRSEILLHPLCQAYMHLNWNYFYLFYFLRLFINIFFLSCLTGYIYSSFKTNETQNNFNSSISSYPTSSESKFSTLVNGPQYLNIAMYLMVVAGILGKLYFLVMTFSPIHFSSVPLRMCLKSYCRIGNLLQWSTLAISTQLIVWDGTPEDSLASLGALAVLFGWAHLITIIGQLPLFGDYIAMYFKVMIEIIKVLIAFFGLLFGFAASFCVIFHDTNELFATVSIAMIKVLAMMTGELELRDFLGQPSSIPLIIFVLCVVLVHIALMNLLVAIAVHDIDALRDSAEILKLTKKAGYVEEALNKISLLRNIFGIRFFRTLLERVQYSTYSRSGKSSGENMLPREIMRAAREIAEKRIITSKMRLQDEPDVPVKSVGTDMKQLKVCPPPVKCKYFKNVEFSDRQACLDLEMDNFTLLKTLRQEIAELKQITGTDIRQNVALQLEPLTQQLKIQLEEFRKTAEVQMSKQS